MYSLSNFSAAQIYSEWVQSTWGKTVPVHVLEGPKVPDKKEKACESSSCEYEKPAA